MKKQFIYNNLEINVGETFEIEDFYDFLGEAFHDAVSYEDYLKNDIAFGGILLLDEEGYDVLIAFNVENDTLTITEIS